MKFEGVVPDLKIISKPSIKFDNGHWKFPEQMSSSKDIEYIGFIYVIRDNYLERLYLGKKQYYGMGKINKGKESDWRKYVSSSPVLKEMFKQRPRSEFEFICLEQYRTKGTLAYSETWSLCLVEAPTSNTWYNRIIEKVQWNVRERITDRHKERLNKILKWEKFND